MESWRRHDQYRRSLGLFSRAEGCWTFDAQDCLDLNALPRITLSKMRRPRRVPPSRASAFVLDDQADATAQFLDWFKSAVREDGSYAYYRMRYEAISNSDPGANATGPRDAT
jgi:hypothetical protein